MKFNYENRKDSHEKIKKSKYDIGLMKKNTVEHPIWLHFGAGNIFRGYIARLQDELLNQGLTNQGIIAAETFDEEIIDKIYKPHNNLVLLATLYANKEPEFREIASIAEGLKASNMTRLEQIITNPSLQMISFTITEKGYNLYDLNGNYLDIVMKDIDSGPEKSKHAMSIATALLFKRFLKGAMPLAVVSMDNCSHNGEKLKNSVRTIAKEWHMKNYVCEEFIGYLEDETRIAFPWSMIDKITPRPAEEIAQHLHTLGFEDMSPITTSKKTYIAPFVNAEECEYLVIEDKFPNGRPPLEKAGVYFTNREIVNQVETMKVTTCLNPLHTALAVFGCLLGYTSIAEEMRNPFLKKLVEGIGEEGMRVVVDPKIIDPKQFLEEVLTKRLPNPSIPDTPQRIATDTSQKIPVRYGETIKSYLKHPELSLDQLKYIPLAIAGWCRYLLGKDDSFENFQRSSDPMLEDLTHILKEVIRTMEYHGELKVILSNEKIFGLDLSNTSLFPIIENYFILMLSKGSVLKVLEQSLSDTSSSLLK